MRLLRHGPTGEEGSGLIEDSGARPVLSGPIGPLPVTKDEVSDSRALARRCEVDGHRCQNEATRTMVYGLRYLMSCLSHFMTPGPGSIVATGTPPGVGPGIKTGPACFKPGPRGRLEVEAFGVQDQAMAESPG